MAHLIRAAYFIKSYTGCSEVLSSTRDAGNLEIQSYNTKETIEDAADIVSSVLPTVRSGEKNYTYVDLSLVQKDEEGNYIESFHEGENMNFWATSSESLIPLIKSAKRSQRATWVGLTKETSVLVMTAMDRISPAYALVVSVPVTPLRDELESLKNQYFLYSVLFLFTGLILTVVVIFFQEREFQRVLRMIERVAEGHLNLNILKRETDKMLPMESNEMHALHSTICQIATNVERMNDSQYRVLQAYYRFAPKEIEKILGKKSILDVEPLDRINTEGTLAFVSFSVDENLSERDYLWQMNRNCLLLGEVSNEYEGIIVSGSSDLSVQQIMFHEDVKKALQFGIKVATRELTDKKAGNAFVFLYRTSFVYGVAGDDRQSFTYVHSNEMKILKKYVDDLRTMGVRMAVTDYVCEMVKEDVVSRYIGFIEDGSNTFNLYEILDAHPADERQKRLELRPKFQKALNLYYKSDFYLARNLFSEVLRSCPMDEVAKWYLFLCESGLNGDGAEQQSFALFSQK